jgi:hypothetical protein
MSAFNGLNDSEEERLRLLIEECAEVSQAACKVLRFGKYSSYNGGINNQTSLEHELGDLQLIRTVMQERGDVSQFNIDQRTIDKRTRINPFLRFNMF